MLGVSPGASQREIRTAYKRYAIHLWETALTSRRESLKSHPDRVPEGSSEKPARTRKFQEINDAYYTLSDDSRRREYDARRNLETETEGEEEIPRAGGDFWSSFGFGPQDREERSNEQFGSVFEEMLREEGMDGDGQGSSSRFWSLVGGASGGALGFIVANAPGALAGAVAGNRLGAVRDARGRSVYEVFLELPATDRARLLSQLAAKVFQHTMGQ